MNTQEAFEAMVTRYDLKKSLNDLANIDSKLVFFIRDCFNYAVLLANTERRNKLAEDCYIFYKTGKETDTESIINTGIKESEISLIYEKFMENLKVFHDMNNGK